jgi:peptidoglycan/LPS O-acetylase OafA/YrhL
LSLSSDSVQKKITPVYFENLDALRFLAAFSVILFHFSRDVRGLFPGIETETFYGLFDTIAQKGHLGVNFFFVLSGFLITYLIVHERNSKGKFSLGKFLIRRTLRIWPLYFIIVLIGFVIFPSIIEGYHTDHNVWMYVGFLANFDEIINGANDSINFLTSPWSVAVEEQFYLFWGIILFVGFKIKQFKPIYLILALYIISFYFRWYYWQDYRMLYFNTITVCQDILMGSLVGIGLFHGNKILDSIKSLPKPAVFAIYIIGFSICILKNKLFPGQLIILERSVLSAFFAFVILDQIRGEHSVFKIGRIKVFNFLGKISYGLYMYHLVVMYLLVLWIESWTSYDRWLIPFFFVLINILVISLSTISFYLIENPLLKLKPK